MVGQVREIPAQSNGLGLPGDIQITRLEGVGGVGYIYDPQPVVPVGNVCVAPRHLYAGCVPGRIAGGDIGG